MTIISLRIYQHEIEGLIEGGKVDEAIAHCQQILKTFPMSVETYQLLGKAFLEMRRYTDAADIFQRALMSVPDDFVAHVGMSIIRDDERKTDDAIWHMERAFEIQPSNPAVQAELKRLYGKRDGIEPPKVRLTRDALANMYSQGELYSQAITEIRSVMAEDANRPDLQVMLARAYYRAGQKVEATEMAMNLLKKYSYCRDALRILVDILPGTERAEDAQVYRQRLEQLDPYSAFVKGSVFQSEAVADAEVTLERLDFKPGREMDTSQPAWASSLGINIGAGTQSKIPPIQPSPTEMADQIPPVVLAATPVSPEPSETPIAPVAQPESEIPDWMRSAGWQEFTGQATESPSLFVEQPPAAEPLAQADIPDWLKGLAPEGKDNALELLANDLPPVDIAVTPQDASPFGETPTKPDSEPISPFAETPIKPDLGLMPPIEFTEPAAASVQPEETEFKSAFEPEQAPLTHAASEALPPVQAAPVQSSLIAEETSTGFPSASEQDEATAWLEGLAAKHGAKPEELLTKPEERPEKPPKWATGELIEKPTPSLEISPVNEGVPPSVLPTGQEAFVQPEIPEEGTPFPAFDETPKEKLAVETPAPEEETPASFVAEQPPAIDEMKLPADELPASFASELPSLEGTVPSAIEPETSATPSLAEATREWLDNLKAEESVRPVSQREAAPESGQVVTPSAASPDASEEDIMDWLKKLDGLEEETPKVPPSQPAVSPTEDLPEWLKGIIQPLPAWEGPKKEELPDWLRASEPKEKLAVLDEPLPAIESMGAEMPLTDENAPVPPALTPTSPEDWLPAEKVEPVPPAPVSLGVEPSLMPAAEAAFVPEAPATVPLKPETVAPVPAEFAPEAAMPAAEVAFVPKAPTTVPLKLETVAPAPAEFAPEAAMPAAEAAFVPEAPATVPLKPETVAPAPAEFTPEAAMPAAEAAFVPEAPATVQLTPETAIPMEAGFAPDVMETAAEAALVSEASPTTVPLATDVTAPATEAVAAPAEADEETKTLLAAQEALKSGNLDEAMAGYSKLIKKGYRLDEVVHELRAALDVHPVDVNIWQTLGDAYNRADKLQDALDAYTKAEELLR